jgi:hypothetical protein
MRITYCDFCGEALSKTVVPKLVHVGGAFRAEVCENCARELITYIESGRNKTGTPKKEGA